MGAIGVRQVQREEEKDPGIDRHQGKGALLHQEDAAHQRSEDAENHREHHQGGPDEGGNPSDGKGDPKNDPRLDRAEEAVVVVAMEAPTSMAKRLGTDERLAPVRRRELDPTRSAGGV